MVLSKSQVGLGKEGQLKIPRKAEVLDRLLIPSVSIVGKCLKMLETYARLWWRLGAASCEGQELPHAYHAQAPDPHPIHQLLTAPAVPYGPASFLFLAVRLEPAVTLASLAGNISSKFIQASYLSFRCLLNGWRLIVFPCAFLNRSKCNTLSPGANAATMTTWHVSPADGGHSISSSQCFLVRPALAVVSSAAEPLSSETSCEDYGQN